MKTDFFDNCGIRNFVEDGKTYICAIDFSNALGYKNNTNLYVCCPKSSRKHAKLREKDGLKNRVFFESESVLTFLSHSRAKRAGAFADWVRNLASGRAEQAKAFCEQVPQTYADALREIARQVEEKEALQAQLEEAKSKARQPSREVVLRILSQMINEAEKRSLENFKLE